jgi:hypothetical protein
MARMIDRDGSLFGRVPVATRISLMILVENQQTMMVPTTRHYEMQSFAQK